MRQLWHPEPEEITLTGVLSALGDPIRLSIVGVLADGREHGVGEFQYPIAKSTLSHHAKVLREAGITLTRQEGTRCFVSLRPELEELFPGVIPSVLAASAGRTDRAPADRARRATVH
ncbi:ArsR/SmtB family transcription factor [Gandjariella thermophila]|uniref:Transcriptional regulator n=1 Tax=Gandjariella thermophila TaxID=1931992 RepID=A0A4D4JAQ0_9PSEU|nr:metalloregulator ArsR/SmtB family transcription factor [Gandjariella thermophila]GDY32090.1 transcriptional regulator [Gandjariella thermophila]